MFVTTELPAIYIELARPVHAGTWGIQTCAYHMSVHPARLTQATSVRHKIRSTVELLFVDAGWFEFAAWQRAPFALCRRERDLVSQPPVPRIRYYFSLPVMQSTCACLRRLDTYEFAVLGHQLCGKGECTINDSCRSQCLRIFDFNPGSRRA